MEEQMSLELNSVNWGIIDHYQFVDWLEALPDEFRTVKKTNTFDVQYLIYYFDKDYKQRLGLIFTLSEYTSIQMARYEDGILSRSIKNKVYENDLLEASKWLMVQSNS